MGAALLRGVRKFGCPFGSDCWLRPANCGVMLEECFGRPRSVYVAAEPAG
jgi:hypothetical protein